MKNGNGDKDLSDVRKAMREIRDSMRMVATQTAENAKQIGDLSGQLKQSRKEHDREMKEIRALFKQMIKRIAA